MTKGGDRNGHGGTTAGDVRGNAAAYGNYQKRAANRSAQMEKNSGAAHMGADNALY